MFTKKTALGAAILAAFTLGANQEASANIYAGSALSVRNLQTLFTGNISSFSITTTNTATLNGNSVVNTATCGGVPSGNDCGDDPALNALVANAPGGSINRADNDFSLLGPGSETYSNADTLIKTAELTGDADTTADQIAETELQTGGTGSANAEIQSSTGFVLTFTNTISDGILALSFEADPYLRALINDVAFLNGNTQANINATFTLTDSSGNEITWSPQGTAANDCTIDAGFDGTGTTCNETADTQDLNRNLSTSINPNDINYSLAAGLTAFGATISGLNEGSEYTLAYNSVTSTQLRLTQVPEPGMLALLGMGILGIGFARRKEAC